ncbi:prepilin-type N-terminal cleavage/methylation domain-containing protein [Lysinibacillus sphaericus]|uniref:prepilin-type N-terminal cleavage/methylation domain-containing protein n=1 Tax=Lysinibacillus sphaericus TaxID=1421 RepID=UPI003D044C4D
MYKKLINKKHVKNEKGLTLIELLAVIVILAIISAIAIPAIGNIIENSRYNAVKADAINVLNAANLYYTDTNSNDTTVTVKRLIEEKYLDTSGKIPDTAKVNEVPRQLEATVTDVLKGTITFDKATIDIINSDTQKGSKIDSAYTVGKINDKTEGTGTSNPEGGN